MNSLQLLRMLGSGIQPVDTGSRQLSGSAPVESMSFAQLLQQAQDGTLVGKQPVTIAPGSDLKLSDDQLARLSLGADRAEAAGLRTALVKLDGQNLIMDVGSREILSAAKSDGGVMSGIDGVLDLGDNRINAQQSSASAHLALPNAPLVQNPSLLKLLSQQSSSPDAAA